jgi:hypothetical protein
MNEDDPDYWPTQLQEIFAAIGRAMAGKRLTPATLQLVKLPDEQFKISHVSGAELGQKKGRYQISMVGGCWTFQSGALEKLSSAAVARIQKSN